MFLKLIASVQITLLLSGCVIPWPHYEQQVPKVTGLVLLGNQPVSGAHVYLLEYLRDSGCSASKNSGITDLNGRFSIKGDKDLRLLLAIGDPGETWGVCIEHEGQFIEALRTDGIGVPPLVIEITCDLASQPRMTRYGEGICEAKT